jgi:hypothetical protein
MQPPVIATHPEEQPSHRNEQNHAVSAEDGLAVLKATFPDLDEEQINTFYELNGKDVRKTKAMISEQLGVVIQTESDEQVAPEDVEFNMLAGQMDPNAISADERKMIEQALRESQHQEMQARQNARQQVNQVRNPAQDVHAVNRAQLRQQQQRQMQQEPPDESEVSGEGRRKKAKKQKKVGKEGNQCCTIF